MILDICYIIDNIFNIVVFYFIKNEHEIVDNLWLGNYNSSQNNLFIKQNNIKLIINLSKELDFVDIDVTTSYPLEKYRIPMNDNFSKINRNILISHYEDVYEKIDSYISNNEGVLIHCRQGMQRSATLTALYLMQKKKIYSYEAKKIIRKKRFIAFFPFNIFESVFTYYDNLKQKL